MTKPDVIVLKIHIYGTQIWRRIHVEQNYPMDRLSVAIQETMGWGGFHEYSIRMFFPGSFVPIAVGNYRYLVKLEARIPVVEAANSRTGSYFLSNHRRALFRYEWDGLNWVWLVDIQVEGVAPHDSKLTYPICVGGEQQPPPEDIGGVAKFDEVMDVIRIKEHKHYKEKANLLRKTESGKNLLEGKPFDIESVCFFR